MKKLIVLDVVGLTKNHFDKVSLPNIARILDDGFVTSMIPSFPAVTCSIQASITSGFHPSEHGIIANGHYDRNKKQVSFWEQYSHIVKKPRIWDILKKNNPNLKTALLFWQNSLYSESDIVITPKPIHLEDGMVMWCYSKPNYFYEEIVKEIGEFDLRSYWGPFASAKSSEWIMNAAKITAKEHLPDLLMIYLPHLDYVGQKYGPNSNNFKKGLIKLDKIIGNFLDFLDINKLREKYEISIISEYGFNQVNHSISPNLILRQEGLLKTKKIAGKEYIDYEYSKAFAMVDHQIAHIFTKQGFEDSVIKVFKTQDNISEILDVESQKIKKIDHSNSAEIILSATKDSWFNYYWWEDENCAPSFTFNVDIHRKPGFDPLELFIDPVTKRISHDTKLINGSHGVFDINDINNLPIFGMSIPVTKKNTVIDITQIAPTILNYFGINSKFPNISII